MSGITTAERNGKPIGKLKPLEGVRYSRNGNKLDPQTVTVIETEVAHPKPAVVLETETVSPDLCDALRKLQRQRSVLLKSRIMQANRIQAVVAGTIGYNTGMPENERKAVFKRAQKIIDDVVAGGGSDTPFRDIIKATDVGLRAFEFEENKVAAQMDDLAEQLPVAAWVKEPQQRGFGIPSLAAIIGECGDLRNYPNPAKLWKRMASAPFESDGKVAMGSTWRMAKEGKLDSEQWQKFGYSPRRRSIAYIWGENLMKLNKSIYRARYDQGRATFKLNHPDYPDCRLHRHGMLLAAKLLMKMLWVEWWVVTGAGKRELMVDRW